MIILEKQLPDNASITCYLHRPSPEMPNRVKRPAMVICPGGGYEMLSDREKDPPALAFLSKGYQIFILKSGLGVNAADYQPLADLSRAIMSIRENAEDWYVEADKIAVMGFSAGGHLAASSGTLWNAPGLIQKLNLDPKETNRPNAMILCYPVITADHEFSHGSSIRMVTGNKPSKENDFSLELHVQEETPPTFLWHTFEDEGVPPENSMRFAEALRKHSVPFELHIFAHGGHGGSLCNHEVNCPYPETSEWFLLCMRWLNRLFEWKE